MSGLYPTELNWQTASSETIDAFAFIPEYGDLIVRFRSGGSYRYGNVDERIVRTLRRPHPWSHLREELTDQERHPMEKLGGIRTKPLKRKKK